MIAGLARLSMTAVLTVAVSAAAAAKCGTAQLNGNWVRQGVADGPQAVTISNGQVLVASVPDATIIQSESCKVTYTPIMTSTVLKGWSDFVSPGTARKPKIIQIGAAHADITVFVRQ